MQKVIWLGPAQSVVRIIFLRPTHTTPRPHTRHRRNRIILRHLSHNSNSSPLLARILRKTADMPTPSLKQGRPHTHLQLLHLHPFRLPVAVCQEKTGEISPSDSHLHIQTIHISDLQMPLISTIHFHRPLRQTTTDPCAAAVHGMVLRGILRCLCSIT